MSESLPTNPYIEDVPAGLTQEQRILRKQRAGKEAKRDTVLEQLETLKARSKEKIPVIERLIILGARARLYTELNKLDLDLDVISGREASEASRYTYIAPIELPDANDTTAQ